MRKNTIIPSIYGFRLEDIKHDILSLLQNDISELHFDVMDGTVTGEIFDGIDYIIKLEEISQNIPFQKNVHLISRTPLNYIDYIKELNIHSISFHASFFPEQDSLNIVQNFKRTGALVGGVATKDMNQSSVLKEVDYIHICKYNYDSNSSYTNEDLSYIIDNCKRYGKPFLIDGGISIHNILYFKNKGVDMYVSGSGIFASSPLDSYLKMAAIITNT